MGSELVIEETTFQTAILDEAEPETIDLVQHTPKREHESVPARHLISPLHVTPPDGAKPLGSTSKLSHTFERIQFLKATANNGKRRAQQQYYHIVVELYAEFGAPGAKQDSILLATTESSPLVVRGRSPGHYRDNERKSVIHHQVEPPFSFTEIGTSFSAREGPDPSTLYRPAQPDSPLQDPAGAAADPSGVDKESLQSPPTLIIDHDMPSYVSADILGHSAHDQFAIPTRNEVVSFDDEDKAFSDSSVSSAAKQSSRMTGGSSITSAPDLSSPLEDTVNILLEDNGIRNLCLDSFTEFDGFRFERNLRRLLKHFANDLYGKATCDVERLAATFFRQRTVHVARLIREACSRTSKAVDESPAELAPWMVRVQDIATGPGTTRLPIQDLDEPVNEDDEDEDPPDFGLEDMPSHDETLLRHFFTKSDAFLDFKEALMDFVVPFMTRALQSRYAVPDNDIMLFLQHRYEKSTAQFRTSSTTTPRYLELCVNTGEHEISLAEIKIHGNGSSVIGSDGDLFREIIKEYEATRHCLLVHKLGLFKPARADHVEFCIEDDIVYIRQSPSAFPSQADLDARRWEFDRPPYRIPSNVFLHLLKSKKSHIRDTWLRRMPKKLSDSILARQDATPCSGPVVG
ncbi:MAG: hypothetical protein Q9160_002070 [Pyrenula sp. 1 TL-2023]